VTWGGGAQGGRRTFLALITVAAIALMILAHMGEG
jgi:hypothetical protein